MAATTCLRARPAEDGNAAAQQRVGRQQAAAPRAKVFRREILARDGTQVIIDVGRPDRLHGAALIDVMKQFVSGKVLAAPHDAGQALDSEW